ncbi:hypothetical protein FJ872_32990 [Mesorhizobium sp. B2-5-9]|nr:hypothetical protein FJ872_32990 [Mesorhizobium sp. B2-5-9]
MAALQAQLAEERKLREEFMQANTKASDAPVADVDAEDDEDAEDEGVHVVAPQSVEEVEAMSDEELKVYIASETGSRPRGNPNHDTLVAAAKELAML